MAMWQIETLADQVSEAEAAARRACELLESLSDVGYLGMAVSQLAASLCSLGRLNEVDELTQIVLEAITANDDVAAQMLWRQRHVPAFSPTAASTRKPNGSHARRWRSPRTRTC